jgi:hypothetical protein
MNSSEQTRKFTPEEIAAVKEAMASAPGIIIDGTTEELPLQFNGLDINMQRYYFAQIYGQLCAQAYRYHLETGEQIEYADIAQMARYMTESGLREVGDGPTE